MISVPVRFLRRLAGRRRGPAIDAAFVAQVRAQLEPTLAAAGFHPLGATGILEGRRRATLVRYAAEPVAFAARYPGAREFLRAEGDPLEFWVARDAATGTVRSELEGFTPAALLAAVRAGPGAPALRRDLGEAHAASHELAVARVADVLRRFLAVAATP